MIGIIGNCTDEVTSNYFKGLSGNVSKFHISNARKASAQFKIQRQGINKTEKSFSFLVKIDALLVFTLRIRVMAGAGHTATLGHSVSKLMVRS